MFRFVILLALVVCALGVPVPDTDGDAAAGNTVADVATVDGEKTDLEGRFGGGGYYPGGGYGQGYPGGYGGYGGGYPGGYGGHGGYPMGGGLQASGSSAQASASSQNVNMGGGGFMPYGK